MEPRVRLTALLVVLNGERLLGRCLDSLSFCDRILIVDSFSTDSTEQIAREHGAIFIQNKWPGNAKQVQYGLDWLEANAPTDWVLMLECDEIISLDLRKSILAALENTGDKTSFSMPRLSATQPCATSCRMMPSRTGTKATTRREMLSDMLWSNMEASVTIFGTASQGCENGRFYGYGELLGLILRRDRHFPLSTKRLCLGMITECLIRF
jgi:glycosyltransferase involved in cell wall biosynthesis